MIQTGASPPSNEIEKNNRQTHMSKKLDAYRKGLERLYRYMEMFLKEGTPPSRETIVEEWRTIDSLKSIPFTIGLSNEPIQPEEGFIILIGEEYERYDDNFPAVIRIFFLPTSQDAQKEINRFLTLQPIG